MDSLFSRFFGLSLFIFCSFSSFGASIGTPGSVSVAQTTNWNTVQWNTVCGASTYVVEFQDRGVDSFAQVYIGPGLDPQVGANSDACKGSGSTKIYNHTVPSSRFSSGIFDYRVKACDKTGRTCGKYSSIVTVNLNGPLPPIEAKENAPNPVSTPLPSVSDLTYKIGSVAGSFRVDESGAATYHIPINLQRGRGGIKPDLSLNYHSSARHGIAGIGWSISGVSGISRCPANVADDGFAHAVMLNNSDRLCLDGQKLVLVSGQYGASGAEYRVKMNDKIRIKATGVSTSSSSSFVVNHIDGSTHYYARAVSGDASSVPTTWLRNLIEDNVGNQLSYNFNESSRVSTLGAQEQLLTSIVYGNGSRVELTYTSEASNAFEGYRYGSLIGMKGQLDKIVVKNHHQETLYVYKPRFKNSYTNGLPLLDSIALCSDETLQTCLPPTLFEYHEDEYAIEYDVNQSIDLPQHTSHNIRNLLGIKPIDYNGDGKVDIVSAYTNTSDEEITFQFFKNLGNGSLAHELETKHSVVSGADNYGWHALDFNLDGKGDVIFRGQHGWRVLMYEGNSRIAYRTINGLSISTGNQAKFMDVDSDGDFDMLTTTTGSNPQMVIFETDGAALNSNPYQISFLSHHFVSFANNPPLLNGLVFKEILKPETINFDFNGDGLPDVFLKNFIPADGGSTTDRPEVFALEKENGEYHFRRIAQLFGGDYEEPRFGDINGDGYTDFIARKTSSSNYSCFFGTGMGISESSCGLQSTDPDNFNDIQLVDYDMDGKSDFVFHNNGRWYFKRSNGMSFGFNSRLRDSASIASRELNEYDQALFIDLDGDGHVGLVRLDPLSKTLYSTLGGPIQQNIFNNRLSAVTDGMQNKTEISYKSMSDDMVYSPTASHSSEVLDAENDLSSSSLPVITSRFSSPLVSSVSSYVPTNNPDIPNEDNSLDVHYFYEDMKLQAGGRGSLGFRNIKTFTDEYGLGITTQTTYFQKYPFVGIPQQTIQYLGGFSDTPGKLRSKAINYYEVKSLFNGDIIIPVLKSSIEWSYLLDFDMTTTTLSSTTTTENEYELKGPSGSEYTLLSEVTITQASGSSNEVKTTTTSNNYDDTTTHYANWWLGRLSSATVSIEQTGEASVVKQSSFSYYTSGSYAGMLKNETLVPNGTQEQTLHKLHCYNPAGDKSKVITFSEHYSPTCTSAAISPQNNLFGVYRVASTEYDSLFQRQVSTSDAQFTQSQVVSFNKFDLPTEVKNIDAIETSKVGVIKRVAYDEFGREFASANNMGSLSFKQVRLYSDRLPSTPSILEDYYYVEKTTTNGKPDSYIYYDSLGRKVATVTQGFRVNEFVHKYTRYNKNSLVTKKSLPIIVNGSAALPSESNLKWTSTTYDQIGRLKEVIAPDGTHTVTNRYGFSSVTTVTQANNGQSVASQQTSEKVNGFGQIIQVSDNASGQLYYDYDALGNMDKVTNVDGQVTTILHDDLGRKKEMRDPNKGTWSYKYNALGELVRQTDANGNYTDSYRDNVGRLVLKKTYPIIGGPNEEIQYTYARHQLTKVCFKSAGTCDINLPIKSYVYDKFGRQNRVNRTIDRINYSQYTTFDQFGRVFQQFDGSGTFNGTRHYYNQNGYMYQIAEAATSNDPQYSNVYLKINQMDEFGNSISISQNGKLNGTDSTSPNSSGNFAVTTTNSYKDETGTVDRILVTLNNYNVAVQDLRFTFDGIGNLLKRERLDVTNSFIYKSESMKYDELNRLSHIKVNSGSYVSAATYSTNGNIESKFGGSSYCYDSAHKQQLLGVGSECNSTSTKYSYDNNGNNTKSRGRNITYSHFNKPTLITSSTGQTEFVYDVDRQRVKRVTRAGGKDIKTYYVGNIEIIYENDAYVKTIRYLPDAIDTRYKNGDSTLRFLHKDHLGSVATITDKNGAVVEKSGFTVWGKRYSIPRTQWNVNSTAAGVLTPIAEITTKGFTGHEHIEHADIIHMNGRIYDPTLGRFLQADPHIQAPTSSQSYNRYAYVMNNPLSYTDPSGFFFKKLFKTIGKIKFLSTIISIGLNFIPGCQAWCSAAFNAAVTYAVTGSLKGALIGAFVGVISPGGFNPGAFLARGVLGGLASKLQGGKFGHGFIAAGASGAAGGIRNFSLRVIASAVIGGTVSKITGGKFANGASSAAFATLVTAGFKGEFRSRSDASGSARVLFATEGTADERQRRFEEITDGVDNVKFKDVYRGKQRDADGNVTFEEFDNADDFKNWLSTNDKSVTRTYVSGDSVDYTLPIFGMKLTNTITMYRSSVMAAEATAYFPNGASDRTLRSYFDNGLRTLGHELAHRNGIDVNVTGGHYNANLEGLNYCVSRGGCNGY
jgi:RHS repeat-associated protein